MRAKFKQCRTCGTFHQQPGRICARCNSNGATRAEVALMEQMSADRTILARWDRLVRRRGGA